MNSGNPIKDFKEFSQVIKALKDAPPELWQAISANGGIGPDGRNEVFGRYEQQLARIANRLGEISDTLKTFKEKK